MKLQLLLTESEAVGLQQTMAVLYGEEHRLSGHSFSPQAFLSHQISNSGLCWKGLSHQLLLRAQWAAEDTLTILSLK